jgi:Mn-dependent DtxR family transcriptional regulator
MHMETLNKQLLVALFDLAQSDAPANVQALALLLNVSRAEVAGGLNQLAMEGLVCPETIRLTFFGLMHATGVKARQDRQRASRSVAA